MVEDEEEHTIKNPEQSDNKDDTGIIKTKKNNSTFDNEELTSSSNNLRLSHIGSVWQGTSSHGGLRATDSLSLPAVEPPRGS